MSQHIISFNVQGSLIRYSVHSTDHHWDSDAKLVDRVDSIWNIVIIIIPVRYFLNVSLFVIFLNVSLFVILKMCPRSCLLF